GVELRMVGNLDDAEDVVQDAFLAAWRTLDTYDADRGCTRAWMLTLVRSRALDLLRKRQRRHAEPLDDDLEWVDGINVEDLAVLGFEASRTRAAVASLPRAQQDTIYLAFFDGLSHLQVARHMDVPLGTVKGRLRLAYSRLRSALPPHAAGVAS